MFVPLLLLLGSVALLVAALVLPGLSEIALVALPCALASLLLLLHAWRSRRRRPQIILDGSNVMYWRGDGPQLVAVRDAVESLSARGFAPAVVFDANVGYKLTGRYLNNAELGRQLGLPRDRVTVVPKGVPADEVILQEARHHGGRIVTNDRYRDWMDAHPEIKKSGHLVRGGYRGGKLWFDMTEGA